MPSNGNDQQDRFTSLVVADAVLAALREHWTSDEVVERIYIYEYTPSEVRSVIAALFEETP